MKMSLYLTSILKFVMLFPLMIIGKLYLLMMDPQMDQKKKFLILYPKIQEPD